MQKIKLLFISVFVLVSFDGCLYPDHNISQGHNSNINKSTIELYDKFASIATKLYDTQSQQKYTIVVSDFIDLETMDTNRIGMLFGQHMRVALNNLRNHNVLDLELSDQIELDQYGIHALSRESNSFNTAIHEHIVGRYNITDEYVEIFVSRVEPKTKIIKEMEVLRIHTKFGINPLDLLTDMVLEA